MKVNSKEATPGCYIEGHWGQYGMDRLADVAEQFEMEVSDHDDPRHWRFHAESDDPDDIIYEHPPLQGSRPLTQEACWERHVWAGDELERWLNELTEGGYWSWEDGEFFLQQTEVEHWLFVTDTDYDAAWQQLLDANINEHNGYTDQYQACELAEDADEGENVYQFKMTIECDIFAGTREEVTE